MGPQVATGDRNLLCRAKISPENPVICNQQVVGSSPTAGSLSQRDLGMKMALTKHRWCLLGANVEEQPVAQDSIDGDDCQSGVGY